MLFNMEQLFQIEFVFFSQNVPGLSTNSFSFLLLKIDISWFSIKYFKLLSRMLKLAILAILSVPSIIASIWKQIANALIVERDTGKLEQTFQALHKEHGYRSLSY